MKTILIILFFTLFAGQGFHSHLYLDHLNSFHEISTDIHQDHSGQDCPACLSSSYKTFLNSKISDGIFSYLKFSYIHPYESTLHDYSLDRSISSRAPPKA